MQDMECLLDVVVICMTFALCIMCTGTLGGEGHFVADSETHGSVFRCPGQLDDRELMVFGFEQEKKKVKSIEKRGDKGLGLFPLVAAAACTLIREP